jgi:uncharacterized protein
MACECLIAVEASSAATSYDCGQAERGSIEELVCKDDGLAALDVKLAGVYDAASAKAVNEHPPALQAEQRDWIKDRDDCRLSTDKRSCLEEEYQQRIAELQARYQLIAGNGPIIYTCDDDPRNEVSVTFFPTEPPTLIAERGDSVSLMYLKPSASGSKYQGRNESFWEHHNCEALITWGYGTNEMRCKRTP